MPVKMLEKMLLPHHSPKILNARRGDSEIAYLVDAFFLGLGAFTSAGI